MLLLLAALLLATGGFEARAASYSNTVLSTPGLAGYWRLNETAGTTAATSIGTVNGVYSGNPYLNQAKATPGDSVRSVGFTEAAGQVVNLPNNAFQNSTWTWEFWAYFAALGNTGEQHPIIHRDPSSASGARQFWIGLGSGSQRFEVSLNYNASSQFESIQSTFTPAINRWYHVVVTVQAGVAMRLYVDGALNSQTSMAGRTPVTSVAPLRFGGVRTNVGMGVFLDEVAFYTSPLTAAQVSEHFNAAQDQGAALAWTTPARTMAAGACSAAITVERRNAANAAVVAPAGGQPFSVSSSAGSGAFFSNNTCTTQVTPANFTIPAGASAATLYYRDSASGTPSVSMTNATGLQNPAAQVHTVTAGAPASMAFTTAARSAGAGACSAVLNVRLRDAQGNTANATTATTLNLAAASGTTFFSDATCATTVTNRVIAIGSNNTNFYARRATAGPDTVTVTATGLGSVNQTFTVTTNAASQMAFATPSRTSTAGECSEAIELQTRDNFDNQSAVSTARTVALTSSSPTSVFYSDPSCTAAITTLPFASGQNSSTFYFRGTAVGTPTLTAQEGTLGNAAQGQTVLAGAATTLRLTPSTLNVESGERFVVVVSPRDAFDNPVASFSGVLAFTSSDPEAHLPNSGTLSGASFAAPLQLYTNGVQTLTATTTGQPTLSGTSPDISVISNTGAPRIQEDASLVAGVGRRYRYNALGAVVASGQRPFTYSTCGVPPGFTVDAASGLVNWTPTGAGTVNVCLAVTNAQGSDQYDFEITVLADDGSPGPEAVANVTPTLGTAPLDVSLDASASVIDAGSTPANYAWTAGPSALPLVGITAGTTFLASGGFPVELSVTDARGREDTARRWVQVHTPSGQTPPTADIVASSLRGEGSLTVSFSCNCTAGSSSIASHRWQWASESRDEAAPIVTFGPGRHRVQLLVVDDNGLTAHDAVEIVVSSAGREPPMCRAYANSPVGPAPLVTALRAVFGQPAGSIASVLWTDWRGETSAATTWERTVDSPGVVRVALRVTDDVGMSCDDSVLLQAADPVGLSPNGPLSDGTDGENDLQPRNLRLGCSASTDVGPALAIALIALVVVGRVRRRRRS